MLLSYFPGSFWSIFGDIFDQIFGQVFEQGFGRGNFKKYSVQFYRTLRKTPRKDIRNLGNSGSRFLIVRFLIVCLHRSLELIPSPDKKSEKTNYVWDNWGVFLEALGGFGVNMACPLPGSRITHFSR